MKRIAIASIASLWASLAFGQANNVSTFMTSGNSTVPGYVTLCINQSNSGLATLCTQTTHTAVFSGADTTTASATLPTAAGKLTFICGFEISGLGATAATTVSPTVGTLIDGNTFTFTGAYTFVAGAALPNTPFTQTFSPCIAGNNFTGPSVTVPGAAGNTATTINVWGYTQ